jgi:hypothetical protein
MSYEATASMEWTDEFPVIDGDYYSRIDEYDNSPTPIRIEAGKVFEFGCEKDLNAEYQAENYQYLGPITPDLFAEAARLREALAPFAQLAVENRQLSDYGQDGFIECRIRVTDLVKAHQAILGQPTALSGKKEGE